MSDKLGLLKTISLDIFKYLITWNTATKNTRTSFIKNLKIVLKI
jgi:hypothetical protein